MSKLATCTTVTRVQANRQPPTPCSDTYTICSATPTRIHGSHVNLPHHHPSPFMLSSRFSGPGSTQSRQIQRRKHKAHIFICVFDRMLHCPPNPRPLWKHNSTNSQKSELTALLHSSQLVPTLYPWGFCPPLCFTRLPLSTDYDILYINIRCSSSSHFTLNPAHPNPISIMSLGPSPSSNQASFGGLQEAIRQYHGKEIPLGKCGSMHMQHIAAPLPTVWSLVCRFDRPQSYKHFIRSCRLISGNCEVGSIREVRVISGLPADTSTERLDALDNDKHLLSFSIIGGDHRLKNYQSTTTVHEAEGGKTIVVESYVVDVPPGSTEEETCIFADTIVTCNLKSLANVAERRARQSSSSRG